MVNMTIAEIEDEVRYNFEAAENLVSQEETTALDLAEAQVYATLSAAASQLLLISRITNEMNKSPFEAEKEAAKKRKKEIKKISPRILEFLKDFDEPVETDVIAIELEESNRVVVDTLKVLLAKKEIFSEKSGWTLKTPNKETKLERMEKDAERIVQFLAGKTVGRPPSVIEAKLAMSTSRVANALDLLKSENRVTLDEGGWSLISDSFGKGRGFITGASGSGKSSSRDVLRAQEMLSEKKS